MITESDRLLLERAVAALERIADALYTEGHGERIADGVQYASYKLEGASGDGVPEAIDRLTEAIQDR